MTLDPTAIAAEMLLLSPDEMAEATARARVNATLEEVKTRAAAARVVAKGICASQGCPCMPTSRRCIAWALYGDLALAGVKALEEAGWLLLPDTIEGSGS